MAILNPKPLRLKIIESVRMCGWNVLFLSDLSRLPINIQIYNEDSSLKLKIYIWNLTHGGYPRSEDEYRIQSKVARFEQAAGYKTLILGWWEDVGVFAGFDIRKHSGAIGYSSSIQVSRTSLLKAARNDFSAHDKGNEELAIAFRPEFFIDYVLNLEKLHDFGESAQDLETLETVVEKTTEDEDFQVNNEDLEEVSEPRKKVIQTVTKKVRQAGFKRRVLTAYSNKCAFCSVQLKLIDAAHILPVAHEESTDYTSNGMALCALHHRAFDNALITINDEYETLVSRNKISDLKAIAHDGGLDNFIENLRPQIELPPSVNDRPHSTFIVKANELRGWKSNKTMKIR